MRTGMMFWMGKQGRNIRIIILILIWHEDIITFYIAHWLPSDKPKVIVKGQTRIVNEQSEEKDRNVSFPDILWVCFVCLLNAKCLETLWNHRASYIRRYLCNTSSTWSRLKKRSSAIWVMFYVLFLGLHCRKWLSWESSTLVTTSPTQHRNEHPIEPWCEQ